ncbi:hypothetical protein L195_g019839 [Trifolium pratense]|uniref:Uncharacterized protein n=1 Tax=Trifolium pratense TaxID=57577 RepID=A0A2K3N0W9_TRIPR|nr:hypothetical protein L195_g019839 [Trifolium pratense]
MGPGSCFVSSVNICSCSVSLSRLFLLLVGVGASTVSMSVHSCLFVAAAFFRSCSSGLLAYVAKLPETLDSMVGSTPLALHL